MNKETCSSLVFGISKHILASFPFEISIFITNLTKFIDKKFQNNVKKEMSFKSIFLG